MGHRVIVLLLVVVTSQHVALIEQLNEADRLKVILEEIRKLSNAKKSQETESKGHFAKWPDYLFQDLDSLNTTAKDTREANIFYGAKKCTPQSKRSIHEQFRRLSHFDPMYMATSAEEAALFPNLNWEMSKRSDFMYIVNRLVHPLLDYTKRDLIKIKLFRRMLEKKLGLPHYNVFENGIRDTGRNSKRNASPFCKARGTLDKSTNSLTLCECCSRMQDLTEDVYPQYINEKKCASATCLGGFGICKTTLTELSFLRRTTQCKAVTENGNTVYLEVWKPFNKFISIGCQCQVKNDSFLSAFV